MEFTFGEEVPEGAREHLSKTVSRCYEVGLPLKSLRTCRPGTDPAMRDLISCSFTLDEEGNCHISIAH